VDAIKYEASRLRPRAQLKDAQTQTASNSVYRQKLNDATKFKLLEVGMPRQHHVLRLLPSFLYTRYVKI